MAYELNCDELYVLRKDKTKEHLRSNVMNKIIENKCGC